MNPVQENSINNGVNEGGYPVITLGSPNQGDRTMPMQAVASGLQPVETLSETAPVAAPKKAGKSPKAVAPEAEGEPFASLTMPKGKVSDYLRDEIETFNHSQLVTIDDPEHPLFNPRDQRLGVSEDLTESLKAGGQIEPGIVYATGSGKYIILAGNRRAANLKALGVKFKARQARPEIGDLGAVFVQIATNEVRVNDTLQVRGKNMQRVFRLNGGDALAVAVMFGVTKQTVRDELSLIENADKAVIKAIDDGIISKTTGVRLSKTKNKEGEADLDAQKKAIEKARTLSAKLGDAKIAAKGKSLGKATKPVKITEATLIAGSSAKPSANLLREIAAEVSTPKDVSNVLLWVAGELNAEGLIGLCPWLKKMWNSLEHAPFEIE